MTPINRAEILQNPIRMSKWLFFLLPSLLFLAACSKNEEVYMHSLDGKWNKKDRQIFTFEIKDAQPKNIVFVVRNNNDYPYSNLRLFSTLLKKGDKQAATDTLNYLMAKPNGEWLGSGFGETREILFQYKTNFRFPTPGTYTVTVHQAMRKDILPGIEDFGIRIEPSSNLK